ncbi:hypothetical protein Bca52824_026263 [Brassica carinata]|uniref:DUF287 domain-containing protein n=1 Tax=Brassica carinata TaxID=52824 RepID=A0A8X7SH98_BRACI|nr:hypothetical protein Bca52824_026263 [Brassica carinata]
MLNRDDLKAKEDGSSCVGGGETAMVKFAREASRDEASPSTIDKLSLREPSKVHEMQMKEKKRNQVRKRKRRNQVRKKADEEESREVEEDKNNEGDEEKEAGDEDKKLGEEHKEPREEEKEAKKGGDEMEGVQMEARNDEEGEERTTQSDIESILVATEAEKELLESIGMGKESCWADDEDDAAVDRWTKIIQNGKQIFFEAEFSIDFEVRTAQVEGLTIPAIGEPSNNAESGHAHADSMEAPGAEALKAMEGRLMNAVRDAMKEVNKKVTSLSNQLTLLEDELKSLRVRVHGMSGDNPSDQDRVSDKESEEHGDDKESEENGVDKESEEEDGGDKESEEDVDDFILDFSKQVQLEHASGDDDVDDTLGMSAVAEEFENKIEKTKTVNNKKKRARTDDGKEVVPSKKAKGCDIVRKAAQKKTRGEKKKKAAEKKQKKKAVAEKKAGQKKAKKGGKKTV